MDDSDRKDGTKSDENEADSEEEQHPAADFAEGIGNLFVFLLLLLLLQGLFGLLEVLLDPFSLILDATFLKLVVLWLIDILNLRLDLLLPIFLAAGPASASGRDAKVKDYDSEPNHNSES